MGTNPFGSADVESSAMAAAESRGPIQVSHIVPNPTQDFAQIGFNVTEPMRLDVSLYDASGMFIKSLFTGPVDKNQTYTLDIQASALQSGFYQVHMNSNSANVVKQFLVTE